MLVDVVTVHKTTSEIQQNAKKLLKEFTTAASAQTPNINFLLETPIETINFVVPVKTQFEH